MRQVQNNFHTVLFRDINHLLTARERLRTTTPGRRLKILSFGCSVGEEVVTLRYLFPEDEIFGCDINPALIETSERAVGSVATVFASSEEEIAARGPFDLILASAVLCVFPAPAEIEAVFPVSRFDEMIKLLSDNLVAGGLLVLTNAAYRFAECPHAAGFTTIRSDIVDTAGYVDVYSRKHRPYLKRASLAGASLYSRRGRFTPRDDEDYADSIFEKKIGPDSPGVVTLRLAEPPAEITPLMQHTRLNTDFLDRPMPERPIVVTQLYELCRVNGTEIHGYRLTVGWTSLVGEGVYWRPPIWREIPSLDHLIAIR